MSKFAVLATLLLLSGPAVGDIVAPDCLLSWSWTFNSLGQNACTVAAYLLSTCYGGSFTISSLAPGYEYTGPSGADNSDLCKCSTVAYNLISACDACQSAAWITWSEYSLNCTTKLPPATFPNPVPAGTRVPQWALLDPTSQNNWNNVTAMATGDSPEVAPGAIIAPSNSSSISSSSGPSATSPSASSTSSSTSPSPTKSSSNAGAIAGGVVGGIAAISIACIAVFFFLRRRRRPRAPSAGFVVDGAPPPQPANMDEVRQPLSSEPSFMPMPSPTHGTSPSMRLYDPNDPTTFPGYQGTSATSTSPAPTYNTIGTNLAPMQVPRAPGYHGLPTV